MDKIPQQYLNMMPDGLIVEWAGRRKFYEVIEELGDSIWYILILLWFVRILVINEVVSITYWQVQLGILGAIVVLFLPAWLELEKWYAEYHIVTRHSDKDGGVIYKFDGILNPNNLPINISPTLDVSFMEYKNNIMYWLWKKITKNRMGRVTLRTTPTNMVINNRRIDPNYYNAIQRVQHSPAPHRLAKDIPFWANIDGIIRAKNNGLVDAEIAAETSTLLLRSLIDKTNE